MRNKQNCLTENVAFMSDFIAHSKKVTEKASFLCYSYKVCVCFLFPPPAAEAANSPEAVVYNHVVPLVSPVFTQTGRELVRNASLRPGSVPTGRADPSKPVQTDLSECGVSLFHCV